MASQSVILFAQADGEWRVAVASARAGVSVIDVPASDDPAPEARAARLGEALRAAGVADGRTRVVLALETNTCLCAPISAGDLPGRQRGQALLYRLEEQLPVAAEEVVADFIVAGDTALGVCVERRVLQPLVDAAESAGVRVRSICPASLLALQHWLESSDTLADEPHLLLWPAGPGGPGGSSASAGSAGSAGPGRVELFALSGKTPVGWSAPTDDPDDVALHVRMAAARAPRPSRLVACGMRTEIVRKLRDAGMEVVETEPVSSAELASMSAAKVLGGGRRPWVELAGGGIAAHGGSGRATRGTEKTRVFVAAAAVVLLACGVAALFARAARYERLTARLEAQQADIFRQIFPGQTAPVDIRSRLASAARQDATSPAGAAGSPQGLLVLRDLMTHLPADVRFRVLDLRLENGAFTLEGEVRSHGDAEAIAAALRRRRGFAVESPRTEQRPGRGVGFTLTGDVAQADDAGTRDVGTNDSGDGSAQSDVARTGNIRPDNPDDTGGPRDGAVEHERRASR